MFDRESQSLQILHRQVILHHRDVGPFTGNLCGKLELGLLRRQFGSLVLSCAVMLRRSFQMSENTLPLADDASTCSAPPPAATQPKASSGSARAVPKTSFVAAASAPSPAVASPDPANAAQTCDHKGPQFLSRVGKANHVFCGSCGSILLAYTPGVCKPFLLKQAIDKDIYELLELVQLDIGHGFTRTPRDLLQENEYLRDYVLRYQRMKNHRDDLVITQNIYKRKYEALCDALEVPADPVAGPSGYA